MKRTLVAQCPACGGPSTYVKALDRYVHNDGWLACSRGQTREQP